MPIILKSLINHELNILKKNLFARFVKNYFCERKCFEKLYKLSFLKLFKSSLKKLFLIKAIVK